MKRTNGSREYYVEWRIDIYADSPEDAARKALEIQRDPESTATYFHVARNGTNPRPFNVVTGEAGFVLINARPNT